MANDFLIANKLFQSLQLSFSVSSKDTEEDKVVRHILDSTSDRQVILDTVIDYIGFADTIEKRYLKAKALAWSGVHRNLEAIDALEIALLDEVSEEQFSNIKHSYYYPINEGKNKIEKRIYMSNMLRDLSNMYLKEYNFNKALLSALNAYEQTPFYAHVAIQVCICHIRNNDLSSAKIFYETVMMGSYYNTDTAKLSRIDTMHIEDYKKIIKNHYDDLVLKIERGYVYKPRPRKKTIFND